MDTLQVPPPRRLRHLIDGAWVDAVDEIAVSVDAVGWAAPYAASRLFMVPQR